MKVILGHICGLKSNLSGNERRLGERAGHGFYFSNFRIRFRTFLFAIWRICLNGRLICSDGIAIRRANQLKVWISDMSLSWKRLQAMRLKVAYEIDWKWNIDEIFSLLINTWLMCVGNWRDARRLESRTSFCSCYSYLLTQTNKFRFVSPTAVSYHIPFPLNCFADFGA